MLIEDIRRIFSEEGTLSSIPGFEFRPQQLAMAEAITGALTQNRHLVVEAPTGVGKSIAYLVPSLLFALKEGKKAVISTHTKNLQSQLLDKDLSLVRSIIPTPFTAVSFKGRGNYLCTTRLRNARAFQQRLFDDDESDQLRRIMEWSGQTPDGDRENLPFVPAANVWLQVCSEKGSCSPSICDADCSFQRARARAKSADLVIMNHALFFTLFGLQESDEFLLFKDDFVVFDEAHTLEQVAGLGSGKSVSRSQVLFAVHRFYHPGTGKGMLSGRRKKGLRDLCSDVAHSVDAFFDEIGQMVSALSGRSGCLRIHSGLSVPDTVTGDLARLRKAIGELQEEKKEKADYAGAIRLLWEAETLIREFFLREDRATTYWADLGPGRGHNVTLHTAPTSVAASVGARLFREGNTVILTSGTLSVNHSLDYFRNRIGAERAGTLILDSPFNYMRQMRVSIARAVPPPDDQRYESALPQMIFRSIMETNGAALVLFTNGSLLRKTGEILRADLDAEGITLLIQDGTMNREHLLERFRNDERSVLFGLDSFWMGVDVPGDALKHVVITRLPFVVPDHPLIESRLELITQRGDNAFTEYTLPEAVLKLKQGVGRLIRSTSDRGIVTILDSRILTRQYGQVFLNSLPPCRVEIMMEDGSGVEIERDA